MIKTAYQVGICHCQAGIGNRNRTWCHILPIHSWDTSSRAIQQSLKGAVVLNQGGVVGLGDTVRSLFKGALRNIGIDAFY